MEINVIVTSNNSDDFNVKNLTEYIESATFNISPLCYEQHSTDQDKIANIKESFSNSSDVILAMRGGSGATRLMDRLRELPKPTKHKTFVGYSDLTVLLNYFQKFENITLIHGPMAFELTTSSQINKFLKALDKQDVIFEKEAKWYKKKELNGEVIGGNLMLTVDMLGTFYEPDFYNKILLIEEINEPIDKLDRMFARLRDSGKLLEISGIILGNFKNCATEHQLKELFDNYLANLDIGILYDVNLGHIEDSDYIQLYTKLQIDETGIYYK